MSMVCNIVFDGINYGIGEAELPEINQQTGVPTGRMVKVKLIEIADAESPMRRVQIRLTAEQLVKFANDCLERKVQPASLQDLANLNGGA